MHTCVGVEFVLELVASSFVLTVVTRVSQAWPSNALSSLPATTFALPQRIECWLARLWAQILV